jgi:hypothetical protein
VVQPAAPAPHQTGRAVLPHPAFRERSSVRLSRTCHFRASSTLSCGIASVEVPELFAVLLSRLREPSPCPSLLCWLRSSTAPSLRRRYRLLRYYGPLRLPRQLAPASRFGHLCARSGLPAFRRRPQPLTSPPAQAFRARRPRRDVKRSSSYSGLSRFPQGLPVCAPIRLRRCTSGSTSRVFRYRGSFDGLHFHCGLSVLLSGCSPPALADSQLPAHSSLNNLIGCMVAYVMG